MPIVVSKDEWDRIRQWTQPNREDPEVVRRREYIKFLDDTSHEMTKAWPNSLENVNKRNEELRQARIAKAEQANTKFYNRYLKRQKEEQERLMYSARNEIFKNKDAPKQLLSAVIETAIQKEREEQLKFNNKHKAVRAERKKKQDEEITRKAKEWNELMETRKKRRFEANKEHQKALLEQAHEIAERNRIEYETEMNLQRRDIMKANEEIAAIKEFDKQFQAEEKARIFADMQRAREEREEIMRENEARSKMDDRLIEVLINSKCRIEQKRKQTEARVKGEKMRLLEQISQRLETGDAAREAKEAAILEKAIKERRAAEDARMEAQRQKEERFRREKRESREQFLREQAQRMQDMNTKHQWELMNRFKNVELYDDYKEEKRLEKERKIKQYREDILKQWKERDDREAKERADRLYFYGELAEKKLRDADNKLLTYAQHLLDEAKEKGRPDYALKRAIDAYCKLYRLYPMPALPASLQEHYGTYAPRDGSAPDPQYVEAPPPPPARTRELAAPPQDDATQTHAQTRPHRADGLQPVNKPVPTSAKPKEEKPESGGGDYKRVGPANGLQRRNLQDTFTLPPINAVPCKTESCRCELKSGQK